MKCIKCKKEIPDGSIFCNYCGIKQDNPKRNTKKRGNGQGTVYRRGNGKWQAEVTLGYYIKNGKYYRKRITKGGFDKKKDALAYLAILQTDQGKKKQITVGELWELFQDAKMQRLSLSRQKCYQIAYKKIINEVSYRKIDDFTVQELQNIVDKFGTSFNTKADIKNLFSLLYQLAMRDDYINKNKAIYIQLPEHAKKEREIFTDTEIKTIWNDYKNNPSPITAHLLIMLYTGMRTGELLTIQKENINLEQQYLTGGIKTEKGKKRKIILPDKILPVIKYLLSITTSKTLSCYRSAYFFRRDWKLKKAELKIRENLELYCCRHTYVTRLTALKISPAMLQELAGHEDYETTLEYTHLSIHERLAEVNRLL
ncbi:MAG: tyrosine-type recombinase/integrase [Oscillospiraceae bacterium]|nr:tyrosine-type recombinase/integrase [Oscillospiraceae bacterium]